MDIFDKIRSLLIDDIDLISGSREVIKENVSKYMEMEYMDYPWIFHMYTVKLLKDLATLMSNLATLKEKHNVSFIKLVAWTTLAFKVVLSNKRIMAFRLFNVNNIINLASGVKEDICRERKIWKEKWHEYLIYKVDFSDMV